ncbi:MAG: hypothetical protein JOY71_26420 [Acetobacteraceae bacterium]|nr:hypothetical protein [Acetobacteraceae bacterium]MBV8525611.1 hypothetical protein [Acetobacteraceae bacterium]MBV8591400.1 hypothetical protein [Acetobacteraceae bacterium]
MLPSIRWRAACVISHEPGQTPRIRIRGCGQAHQFQHISAAPDLLDFGARAAMQRASARAGMGPSSGCSGARGVAQRNW